ncbi:MAG: hypothetical protein ACREPQ_16590 [Rhodanobacter sp.]
MKTWISEDTGPAASIDALLSVTAYFGIEPELASEMLGNVVAAVANWRQTGRTIGMSEQELDQFSEAFEHPELDAARQAMA